MLLWRRSMVWDSLLQRRCHSSTASAYRCMVSFAEEQFRELFRFRKLEFCELLFHFQLSYPDGRVRMIRVGRRGHRSIVPGDWALMIVLARLSYPCRYIDLHHRFGGSRTVCGETFLCLVERIDMAYGHVVTDIRRFLRRGNIKSCCDIMGLKDRRLSHVFGFLDTTFQSCARPGGDGAVFANIDQNYMWSGHKKSHGMKWQVMVFSNGLSVTSDEFPGGRGDATILGETHWLTMVEDVSVDLGFDACFIADGSYSRSRNLLRRNIRDEQVISDRESDRLNSWRVLVENDFAGVHSNWGFLTSRSHCVIATSPYARIWRVSFVLHNLQTLSYGNQVTARLGYYLKHLSYDSYLNGP